MSTPQPQMPSSRFGLHAVQQTEFTQADVAAAISRFLGVASSQPAVAAIASRINVKGIQISPGGDLAQSGDFQNRILAAGGTELAQIADPSKIAQLLHEQAQRANVTSAEGARLAHGLDGRFGWRSIDGAGFDGDRSSRTAISDGSSIKYSEMSMTPSMRAAHELALKTPGMSWAAHNPSLLRTPGAIETFIQAKIREDSYKAVKGAGFTDRDAVAAAKWGLAHGKNGNDVFHNMADSVRTFGHGDAGEEKRWRDLFNNFHTHLNDSKAQEEMRKALKAEEAHPDTKRRDQARKMLEFYKLEQGAQKDADAKVERAGAKEDKADIKDRSAEVRIAAKDEKAAVVASRIGDWNTPSAGATPQPKPGEGQTPADQTNLVKKADASEKPAGQSAKPKTNIAQAGAPKPPGR